MFGPTISLLPTSLLPLCEDEACPPVPDDEDEGLCRLLRELVPAEDGEELLVESGEGEVLLRGVAGVFESRLPKSVSERSIGCLLKNVAMTKNMTAQRASAGASRKSKYRALGVQRQNNFSNAITLSLQDHRLVRMP
jgi:hypothetical protein